MPLIPLRPLLEATVKYGFGQGAFNVNAVAQAKAAIEVHEMFRSAAILQGADPHVTLLSPPKRFLLAPSGRVRFLCGLARFYSNHFLFSQLSPWNISVSLQMSPWTETLITF